MIQNKAQKKLKGIFLSVISLPEIIKKKEPESGIFLEKWLCSHRCLCGFADQDKAVAEVEMIDYSTSEVL